MLPKRHFNFTSIWRGQEAGRDCDKVCEKVAAEHKFLFIAKRTACPLLRDCQCALFFRVFLLFDPCQWDILFDMIMVIAHIFLFIAKRTGCPLPREGQMLFAFNPFLHFVCSQWDIFFFMIMVFLHKFSFIAKRTFCPLPRGGMVNGHLVNVLFAVLLFWSWSMKYFV